MKKKLFSTGLMMLGCCVLYAQNSVSSHQEGDGNDVQLEFVEATGNTVETMQLGDNNLVDAYIYRNTNLYYQVYQEGDGNTAELNADGAFYDFTVAAGNQVYLEQIGDNNYARQSMGEGGNLSTMEQYGNSNYGYVVLDGFAESSLLQWGDENYYELRTPGGINNAIGVQIGYNNYADKLSDANGTFNSYQAGSNNQAIMASQAIDLISSTQTGNNNYSNQGGGGTGSSEIRMTAFQLGNNNQIDQGVALVGAELDAVQLGSNNTSNQESILGSDALSVWGLVYQQGNGNSANAITDGSYYLYEIIQLGNRNEAELRQELNAGTNLTEAYIGQFGNDNYAYVEQFGFQQTNLIQTGNGNSAVIIEH